jgi:hypothetical protein
MTHKVGETSEDKIEREGEQRKKILLVASF